MKVEAKYGVVYRTVTVGLIAMLATLRASIGDGLSSQEWVDLFSNTLVAVAAYLGIGAASPHVEPFFVNKAEQVEVPVPPAVKDTP